MRNALTDLLRDLDGFVIFIGLLMFLLLVGCGTRNPESLGPAEYFAATGAASTIRVVSEDPALVSALPSHATILGAAAGNLENALQVTEADPASVGPALVTPSQLQSDPATAARAAQREADVRDKAISTERSKDFWSNLLTWGGWSVVGGIGLYLARAFNVPGVALLTDPMVKVLGSKWIKPMEEKAAQAEESVKVLSDTVESSMVAREGLKSLDKTLAAYGGTEVADTIKSMTGGDVGTVDGLFKWLAQSHARNSAHIDSVAVADVVDEIRDTLPAKSGSLAGALLALMTTPTPATVESPVSAPLEV